MDIFLSIPAKEQENLWGFVCSHPITEHASHNAAINCTFWYWLKPAASTTNILVSHKPRAFPQYLQVASLQEFPGDKEALYINRTAGWETDTETDKYGNSDYIKMEAYDGKRGKKGEI